MKKSRDEIRGFPERNDRKQVGLAKALIPDQTKAVVDYVIGLNKIRTSAPEFDAGAVARASISEAIEDSRERFGLLRFDDDDVPASTD